MEPATGKQWEISHAGHRAVVVEFGGGLRAYSVDGQDVLEGYAEDHMADGGRGLPLLPWPNRLADGRYAFNGQQYQLPIDEVARNNAMHGLTRSQNWTLGEHTDSRVRVELVMHPRGGYPFLLALEIEYALDAKGLRVTTRARNRGGAALPFGAGQHPYFSVGTSLVDETMLGVPAALRLDLDEVRRLPTGKTLGLDGTPQDFREPRRIGELVLDDCYTDLQRDADGIARATLRNPTTNRHFAVWVDAHYKYLMLFSGDTLPAARRRTGLAIEPMTCPPNALATGSDVIVIQPSATFECAWGVEV